MITEKKKDPRGRKPVKDKKMPITVYANKSKIRLLGGIAKARLVVSNYIDSITINNHE